MPWNRSHIVGQKPPLKPHEVWSIRTRLQVSGAVRDLALFDLAIDSKLRGCDLVAVTVGNVALSGIVGNRVVIIQRRPRDRYNSRLRSRPEPLSGTKAPDAAMESNTPSIAGVLSSSKIHAREIDASITITCGLPRSTP
jgi:hypothetical protein